LQTLKDLEKKSKFYLLDKVKVQQLWHTLQKDREMDLGFAYKTAIFLQAGCRNSKKSKKDKMKI
jgi:hypothetical protein